jgi:hypothetical protein
MKKIYTVLVLGLTFLSINLNAQSNKCATMKVLEERMKNDPSIQLRMDQSEVINQKWISANGKTRKSQMVVSIPVVVHVIYNNSTQNISTSQILSQIDILNEDFRLLNSDTLDDTHPFWEFTADTEIEFCLATLDPDGNSTSGITRTFTDSLDFVGIGNEKYTATGGEDNWDPTSYLNIWVCDLSGSGGTLGYATFPSDLAANPDEDGVVISYSAFGDIGTVSSPNDLGRTATHEVGHWLNLRHIWGDNFCGDDFVADTEVAEANNFGCPNFPFNADNGCGSGVDGEMFMNYMDYVDDYCMVMFTYDQGTRMQSALNNERADLLNSIGCESDASINEITNVSDFEIFPNPSNGSIVINTKSNKTDNVSISLYNLVGEKVQEFNSIDSFPFQLNLTHLVNGSYFIEFYNGVNISTEKIVISK